MYYPKTIVILLAILLSEVCHSEPRKPSKFPFKELNTMSVHDPSAALSALREMDFDNLSKADKAFYNNIKGKAYAFSEHYDSAKLYLIESKSAFQKLIRVWKIEYPGKQPGEYIFQLQEGEANAYLWLGELHRLQSQPKMAISEFESAIKIFSDLSSVPIKDMSSRVTLMRAFTDEKISMTYENDGNFKKAILHGLSANETFIAKESSELTHNTERLAHNYLRIGNYDSATYYSEFMLENISRKDKGAEQTAYSFLGSAYAAKKDFEKAMPLLEESISYLESVEKSGILIDAYFYLGDCYIAQKSYSEGLEVAYKGLALAKEVHDLWEIQEAYKHLHHYYEDMAFYTGDVQHYEKTITYMEKSYTLKDSLVSIRSDNDMEELRIQYENENEDQNAQLQKQEKLLARAEMKNYILLGIIVVLAVLYIRNRIQKAKTV
ncbi:tetratricopeptide repeat protein [Fulvivirga ligni]|uniref:tetratricopeptide repeat protein n=1 Tax=Fulvivirga ligni TaxID=2904246 RepID=UPI001F21140C|nr:hypothetical protein [Fulvivirga ligni]UII23451.1 hypothetical protein LVD16_09450 [Fulvivirga ligni]